MESLVLSLVTALTGTASSAGNHERVYIVVPGSRAYLVDLLAKAFQGRQDIEIVVDRRRGERRMRQQPVAAERRRADRRRSKDEVIEVVIGVGTRREGPG